jgi:hypothetical protein
MRTIRITVGGVGDPGGPGRRRIGTRVWPWQSLSSCQNIVGKIVCPR